MLARDVPGGYWWRFDRYELRDRYIGPAGDARLERYDPWEAYRIARAGREEKPAPYETLLALLQDIPRVVSGRSEQRILDWCARHGLLGILLQRTEMVTLPVDWAPLAEGIKGITEHEGTVLWPTLTQYMRDAGGWRTRQRAHVTHGRGNSRGAEEDDFEEEQLDPDNPGRYFGPSAPLPGVVLHGLWEPGWVQESLDETWASFFPAVPYAERATYRYPRPTTDAFWRLYAEPLDAFLEGAEALAGALYGLQGERPFAGGPEASDAAARSLAALHTLVAPVSAALAITEDGALRQRWLAPSLLGSFAMMALQDLAGNRRVLACNRCGGLFTAAAYQARYCSPRCRNAAQKAALRSREAQQEVDDES